MDKAKLIWFALLASVGIYAALPLLIPPMGSEPQAGVLLPLAAAALMTAAMSFVVPSLIAKNAPPEQQGEQLDFTLNVVRWALAEAVAVFGLVLYLLGHPVTFAWGFAIASAVLMFVHAPRPTSDTMHQSSADLARPDVKIG